MVYGANVQGDRAGVVGTCGSQAGRESDVEGVGVYGSGNTIGVFGKTVSLDFSVRTCRLIRAGLRFTLPIARLPARPMSWRLRADVRPAQLQMQAGLASMPGS